MSTSPASGRRATDEGREQEPGSPTTVEERRGDSWPQLWSLPVFLLVLLWMVLAFSSGGFLERQWLLPAAAAALFAVAAFASEAYPRPPRGIAAAVLGLFFLYGVWVTTSAAWAPSTDLAWQEASRTFLYITVFALAVMYLSNRRARRVMRYLFPAVGLFMVAMATYRLWAADELLDLFLGGRRFQYPVSYPNNAAALYLLLVWPLLWLASDPREYPLARAVSLGTMGSLLTLFVLTQSRGGLYALVISGILLFLLSPARLRMLFYLLVPGVLLVWSFPTLNEYWLRGVEGLSGSPAAYRVAMTFVVGGFTGLVLSILERWVDVSTRMRLVFGAIIVVAAVGGLALGANRVAQETGGVATAAEEAWEAFAGEERIDVLAGGLESSRLATVSASGRIDIWRVGWKSFTEHPWVGVGAEGYVFEYDRERSSATAKPRQPHSIELRVLSETGLVGGVLLFGAFLVAIAGVIWPRLSRGSDPRTYALDIALLAGFLYWLIHASVEWLWHMPGISVGAFLLLALGVARVDAWMDRRRWETNDEHESTLRSEPGATPGATTSRNAPVGPLSWARERAPAAYRWIGLAVAGVLLVGLLLPYLSLRFQELALSNAGSAPRAALADASRARFLAPFDPALMHVRADVYDNLARRALYAASATPRERVSAALDGLALSARTDARAVDIDPAGWAVHFRAATSLLDFYAARNAADVAGAKFSAWADVVIDAMPPGVRIPPSELLPPGASPVSPAETAEEIAGSRELRGLANQEIVERVRRHLTEADARNPLNPEVDRALSALAELPGID